MPARGIDDRPLRIALQIERFDPARGGAEGYAGALARGLLALGQEVSVIAYEARNVPSGVAAPALRVPRHPKWLRALAYARESLRVAREGRYDIVHALGKSLGMNILNPHGGVEAVWLSRESRSHAGRLARRLWTVRRYLSPRHHVVQAVLRRQYRDPAVLRYVALSRSIGEAMARVHGVNPGRIVVLPNGVDRERFRPPRDGEREEIRVRLGLPRDGVLLLFVANNFRLKGLRPLIEGLARIQGGPPAALAVEILGRGPAERYRRLAERRGIGDRIRFRGAVPGIEEWYRAADGLVHPTFYDASSLTLPEAMASGLPVLASRQDGSAEAITDGVDGVLLDEPDDAAELAARLRLFLDPAWRRRLGAAARARVLREPPADPAVAMLRIYREALEEVEGRKSKVEGR